MSQTEIGQTETEAVVRNLVDLGSSDSVRCHLATSQDDGFVLRQELFAHVGDIAELEEDHLVLQCLDGVTRRYRLSALLVPTPNMTKGSRVMVTAHVRDGEVCATSVNELIPGADVTRLYRVK